MQRQADERERRLYAVWIGAYLYRADKFPPFDDVLNPKQDVEVLTGLDADRAAAEFAEIGKGLGVETVWQETQAK